MKFDKINNLKTGEIKTPNGYKFPTYKTTGDSSFLLGLICGNRNAGKSSLILNMIQIEKDIMLKGANKVIYISPTIDDKVMKVQEMFPDNFEIVDELTRAKLVKVFDKIESAIEEWKELYHVSKILKKYKKGQVLTDDELELLEMNNFGETKAFENFNAAHPPIHTIIVDDSACSPCVSNGMSKDGRYFLSKIIKHRHHPIYSNIFILTQHAKLVMKQIRVNCNLICMFPMRDQSVLKSLYDEFSTLFGGKMENYMNCFAEIERRANHSFLFLYWDKLKFLRIGLDENVSFGPDENIDSKTTI